MPHKEKMPVVFIGHGSPENAFEENEYSEIWGKIAAALPIPKAILVVSAHWAVSENGTSSASAITAMEKPRTIHDFYGFPKEYYDFHYEAEGSPELAKRVQSLVKTTKIVEDFEWGLDHGAWSVLKKMYPTANIPVVQLSLNENLSPEEHFAIGKELAPLREEGVLILGSGNIVHNLRMLSYEPHPWALDFDAFIKESLVKKDFESLIHYDQHPSAKMALPSDEHYIPLLYAVGAAGKEDPQFFNETISFGSLAMRCVLYGGETLVF